MLELTPTLFVVLGLTIFVAGLSRGFTGFGDALIFLPIAGFFMPPVAAITVFMIVGSIGPLPILPSAMANARRDILIPLNVTMLATLPIGFGLLTVIDAQGFRLVVAVLAILLAALMFAGWRPRVPITRNSVIILGVLCGVIGGLSGVPGAFLIFFFLNSGLLASGIRAQTLITLLIYDAAMVALVVFTGRFEWSLLWLALGLFPIYTSGAWLGKFMFDPRHEILFRRIALFAILASGVIGMPYVMIVEFVNF